MQLRGKAMCGSLTKMHLIYLTGLNYSSEAKHLKSFHKETTESTVANPSHHKRVIVELQ